jgi:two-component system KDP operon response regulator KdpE
MMVASQNSVLIVEDELLLRTMLRTSLRDSAFSVEEAHSGEEALRRAHYESFDLVLLDVNIPGIGGVEACRRLKDWSPRTGIVAMVTERDLMDGEVPVLEAGADDYVTKPFGVGELIARLKAVLRRTRSQDAGQLPVLQAGKLTMDPNRRILWRAGNEVHLSPKQFDLLAFMMQNQNTSVSHAELLRSVWGPSFVRQVDYLRSYVYTLRKKIEVDPTNPDYILTAPWVGYRFRNPSAEAVEMVSVGAESMGSTAIPPA